MGEAMSNSGRLIADYDDDDRMMMPIRKAFALGMKKPNYLVDV